MMKSITFLIGLARDDRFMIGGSPGEGCGETAHTASPGKTAIPSSSPSRTSTSPGAVRVRGNWTSLVPARSCSPVNP